jgi:multidrug resistance efflux pump
MLGTAIAKVETAAVTRGTLLKTLRLSGSVGAKNFAAVRAPTLQGANTFRGALTLMELARAGSKVAAGDVVAVFELRAQEEQVDNLESKAVQSRSDVEKRRAEIMIAMETLRQSLRTAEAEYEKAKLDLRTAEVRSEIEGELLRLAVEETEAKWKQLEQEVSLREEADAAELRGQELLVAKDQREVDRLRRDLQRMRVTTPVGGLVVLETIPKGSGQFDQTQLGDQVFPGSFFMRVVDLSEMIVKGMVNQADSQSIRLGQKAEVRLDAYPDMALAGRVTAIGAMAASGSSGGRWNMGARGEYIKWVDVEVTIDTKDARILPDLSASADLVLDSEQDKLLVPRSAIHREGDQARVYVRQGDRFVDRLVELGTVNEIQAVVISGLQEGEEVALNYAPPV